MDGHTAWIQVGPSTWYEFAELVGIVEAVKLSEVMPALRRIEDAAARGVYAAGFVSYGAAPAFDSALTVESSAELPLLWFGLYRMCRQHAYPPFGSSASAGDEPSYHLGKWRTGCDRGCYEQAIRAIRDYIRAGDTYQVNYTFQQYAHFDGDPRMFFRNLCRSQREAYSAYLDLGSFVVCSASPELFFHRKGNRIISRPMKGTAPRGVDLASDQRLRRQLEESEKDRAENVMIVDMIRNDLGRIAEPGTVSVSDMLAIERYRTVYQMTTTVSAETEESLEGIFGALFPCASITGAPKKRAMEIIRELEPGARGLYTGAIGCIMPDGEAQFNVAIRSPIINRRKHEISYGVGGGIVWDSDAAKEFEECRTKTRVLKPPRSPLTLFETILWRPEAGYYLLGYHLSRMEASAAYFGILFDSEEADEYLQSLNVSNDALRDPFVVKFLVDEEGGFSCETRSLPVGGNGGTSVIAIAENSVSSDDWRLYHKTNHRGVYDKARERYPTYDDVLLQNERGEITESTIANVVIERKKGGPFVTPPVRSGVLAGTKRAELLDAGRIVEGVLHKSDLRQAHRIYLINSVREWTPVHCCFDA